MATTWISQQHTLLKDLYKDLGGNAIFNANLRHDSLATRACALIGTLYAIKYLLLLAFQ